MTATVDEFMVVCISRQLKDGELVVQGLSTPLVAAGYLLARATHAPNLYFASAIGQGICRDPAPLGLTRVEELWLDRSLTNIGFARVAAEFLPNVRPKEFFRPAQIDPNGNINNIAFGKNLLESGTRFPRLRLPGSGGIPDVTTFIDDIYLYVPRHSKVTFVSELDLRSGLGYSRERVRGSGPKYLISNLGEFDFANGHFRLTCYHPGVSISKIRSQTGFDIDIAPDVHETTPPTENELRLLREKIDPLGIRRLELLSSGARRDLLLHIINIESAPTNVRVG